MEVGAFCLYLRCRDDRPVPPHQSQRVILVLLILLLGPVHLRCPQVCLLQVFPVVTAYSWGGALPVFVALDSRVTALMFLLKSPECGQTLVLDTLEAGCTHYP